MNITESVNLLASLLGIIAVAIPVYIWVTKKIKLVSVQDPKHSVAKERLSFEDVKAGIEILVEDALRFKPDYIFGINRGGAIVGGMMAKKLKKPLVYILEVNFDKDTEKRVVEHRIHDDIPSQNQMKILLTDDAFRAGEHMSAASNYLKQKYPNAEIRRVVLLEIKFSIVGPESSERNLVPVERHAFFTYDGRVKNAWDA
jgi:hypoxanthine phosphoribosyltransferase